MKLPEYSIQLLKTVFTQQLEDDYFGDLLLPTGPYSVREFIEFMTAGNVIVRASGENSFAQFPDLTNLNMTFAEFMGAKVRPQHGEPVPIGSFACAHFSDRLVRGLARKAAEQAVGTDLGMKALGEVGAKTWPAWVATMSQPGYVDAAGGPLFEHFFATLKDRPLLSFFIREKEPGKFRSWSPRASSGEGRKLPTRITKGKDHSVNVSVSRYDSEDGDSLVIAYEWLATLCKDGAEQPEAAACGMVYVFDREDGAPTGDLNDLLLAADIMTDEDTLQAKAFIRQHQDAGKVIQTSDLCFVWIWERREDADKGLGAQCLRAGLEDLKRRFKRLRTVVIDVRPSQFVDWSSEVDPPMVTVEKQSAIESLIAYIESLQLKFDVRPILNRSTDSFRDALVTVGQASIGAFHSGLDDDDDESDDSELPEIDIDLYAEELAELFRRVGLSDLADSTENSDACYEEVITALCHIVFDPHVHYLRFTSTTGAGLFAEGVIVDEMTVETAANEMPGTLQFLDSLPDDFELHSVFILEGGCPIYEVRTRTPFGELAEHYTLVQKPRPINMTQFYRDTEL